MLFLIFLIVLVVASTAIEWWKKRHLWKLYKELNSKDLKYWPIVGNAIHLFRSSEGLMGALIAMGEAALKMGGSYYYWTFNRLSYLTCDPIEADFILTNFLEKDFPARLGRSVGYNLIMAPVVVWRTRRKSMGLVFNGKGLSDATHGMKKHANVFAERLMSTVGMDFNIWTQAAAYSMDSVCENILGVNLEECKNKPDSNMAFYLVDGFGESITRPWYWFSPIFRRTQLCRNLKDASKILRTFVNQQYSEIQENLLKKKLPNKFSAVQEDQRNSMLQKLICLAEQGKGLSDCELQEEMMGLFLAAIDTSTVAITCTLWLLARHPEIQEKVYNELREYYGDSDTPVSGSSLTSLKYLDAVIKETLRLFPPVPAIVRRATHDITLPSGRKVKKGMSLFVHVQGIHRNQKYWGSDADEFRPERFLEEPKNVAYIPFGKGARVCLGLHYAQLSLKSILAKVLKQFRFTVAPGKDIVKFKCTVTVKPLDGNLVRVELRK